MTVAHYIKHVCRAIGKMSNSVRRLANEYASRQLSFMVRQ